MFRGNVDNNTPYANSFTPPIKAQYVRLYPQVCRRHCTLRMELLGCELSGESHIIYFSIFFKEKNNTFVCNLLLTRSFSTPIDTHSCYRISRERATEENQCRRNSAFLWLVNASTYNKFLLETFVYVNVLLFLVVTMIYVLSQKFSKNWNLPDFVNCSYI